MSYYYLALVVLNSWKCVLEHVYIGELGDMYLGKVCPLTELDSVLLIFMANPC